MKRSIISIALSVALVLTSMCAMFVMPASAANGIDYLLQENIASITDGATAEVVDGELVFTATAAGQEVSFCPPEEANLNDYPFFEAIINSDMPFDICWNDANNGKWIFGAGDFCYNFNGNQGAGSPIAAGSENVKFSLTGAYTWTGAPLPANAAIKQIIFIAKAAGTMTVSKCMMTDGIDDVSLDTASYDPNVAYDNAVSLLGDADAWTSKNVNGSDAVVTADGESLVFSNTAGNWPSAYINFEEPIVVNAAEAAVYADFAVKQSTTVYLYLNGATADLAGYADNEFVAITPVGAGAEIGTGNYFGTQVLSDILPEGAVDENGNVSISAISVFATGTAGATCVKVNAVDLLYNNVSVEPETYITYTVNGFEHEGDIAEGEEITVDVTATATDDFCGFNFDIAFDDAAFEFVGAEWGAAVEAMAEGTLKNVNDTVEAVDGVKEVRFTVQGGGAYALAEGDVLVSVTLKAKAAITEAVEIAINDTEVTSDDSVINEYELVAEGVNGIIEIVAPAYILGDVNSDEEIDMFDVLALFKHVSEEELLEDDAALAAADVDYNEEVDMFDVLQLFKFVSEEIDSL